MPTGGNGSKNKKAKPKRVRGKSLINEGLSRKNIDLSKPKEIFVSGSKNGRLTYTTNPKKSITVNGKL